MKKINFNDFAGSVREKLNAAGEYLKNNPDTELFIPAGEYILTDERLRQVRYDCMHGNYGENPQPVMFNPNFEYSKGLDLEGCKNITVNASGAKLVLDGFGEPVSIKNAENIRVIGLEIDHLRKPFSRGRVISRDGQWMEVLFDADMPIPDGAPALRNYLYDPKENRICKSMYDLYTKNRIEDNLFRVGFYEDFDPVGKDLYITHTYHSRPAVLISHSKNTVLENVIIRSQPGMGIVGFKSENIRINGLKIIPAKGYDYSTNTDATHFASCRGVIHVENSEFAGHGDDAINVHNYYYTITKKEGNTCTVRVITPDGTHSQEPDYPEKGYVLRLVRSDTLQPCGDFTVTESDNREECNIVLDKPLPDGNAEEYSFANMTDVASLEFIGNTVRNHLARSVLCKTRNALIEGNVFKSSTGTAVHIASEVFWSEGIAVENVIVRNNKFIECAVHGHGRRFNTSAVCVDIDVPEPSACDIHKNVVIENNEIIMPDSLDIAISLRNAQNVLVRGNTIEGKGEISVNNCSDVRISR